MAKLGDSLTTSVLKQTLISGCHILHHHHVLDAYGHLSVRNPDGQNTFFMPRDLAPGLVSSAGDILQYFVEDASPVDPASSKGYVERFIHSEIYRKYPDVQSVVHSHAPSVLPYTITGHSVQKFDVSQFYTKDDILDLLIRNKSLGAHFADCFSRPGQNFRDSVVLMRGDDFTVVGGSIEETVFHAIYTAENATIQTTAITISAMAEGSKCQDKDVYYLEDSELHDTTEMTKWSVMRPWGLWVREVEASGLYTNLA